MDSEQSRQLAKDENTPPEKLRELAYSSDPITRQNVVANPNVPPDVLIKLAKQFPRQVFNNPAIDLLLLETPNLFSGTFADALCSLLKREVPERAIEYALNSTDERFKLAILMNPQTSSEILEQLAKSTNTEISEAAKTHINYLPKADIDDRQFVREKNNKTLEPADKYMEFEIAFNKVKEYPVFFEGTGMAYDAFTRKISNALSKKDSSEVLPSILSNKEIEKLSNLKHGDFFKDITFLCKVAANPHTPLNLLERIVDLDKCGQTHLYLAENYSISPKIIKKILDRLRSKPIRYGGYNYEVKTYRKIIANPATSIEILETLANHTSVEVKAIAANCPEMPKHLVKKILFDFDKDNFDLVSIQYEYRYLIENLSLSSNLINKLLSFSNSKKQPDKKHNRLRYGEPLWGRELSALAKHPNINAKTLKLLLEHEEKAIRNSAFQNQKIPQFIANQWGLSFLDTLNIGQLQIIAKNIFTPEIILEKLVEYDNNYYYVVQDVLNNSCITQKIIDRWEKSPHYNPRILAGVRNQQQRFLNLWKLLLTDCNRLTILLDIRTPIPLLNKVSLSTSWLERYAIVQNPNTPLPIIKRLAEDGNRIVRAAAKLKLETKQ